MQLVDVESRSSVLDFARRRRKALESAPTFGRHVETDYWARQFHLSSLNRLTGAATFSAGFSTGLPGQVHRQVHILPVRKKLVIYPFYLLPVFICLLDHDVFFPRQVEILINF